VGILHEILKWDYIVYQYISKQLYEPSAFFLFELITNVVDLLIVVLTAYWLFTLVSAQRSRNREITAFLAPAFITGIITVILKILIQRGAPTPFVVPWAEIKIPFLPWGYAFPSGHAARAFALATAIAIKYPKRIIPLFVGASLIGFSRVYIGAHYPLDVIAGTFLGISVSLLLAKLSKNN